MLAPPYDVLALRAQIPALARQQDGRPVVFADGPGGTQVPAVVAAAMTAYLATSNANFGGRFATSRETNALTDAVRGGVARLLNAARPEEIVFGQNMTSLTFALSRAVARTWQAGDEIVVSALDHDANVQPWVLAAEDRGVTVRVLPCTAGDLTLALEDLTALLTSRTRLVALTVASNAVGSRPDLAPLLAAARAMGALTYLDAVHAAPHLSLDVQALGCDFLACSAYKFSGPHLGILYGRYDLLASFSAYKVRPSSALPPGKWETGTQNTEAIAGLHACLRFFGALGGATGPELPSREHLVRAWAAIASHEQQLTRHFLGALTAMPGVQVHGIGDPQRVTERTPTFGLTFNRCTPRQACEQLAAQGIFAWDGHFYAMGLIAQMGLAESGGLLRLGFSYYTTMDEVDRIGEALRALAS